MLRRLAILWLLTIGPCTGRSQPQRLGIAYYDVERLYDTVVSPFYNDTDYTPEGRLRWNTERYRRKIAHTAAVLDSMALPLVALYGVENEAVVRDLVQACCGDYSYFHRTLDKPDGLDFALLYYGDRFFPHYTEPGNNYLYIEGSLASDVGEPCDTLGLLLCRNERMACLLSNCLRKERPGAKLLILGRFKPAEIRDRGFRDATARAERAGRGNFFRRAGWQMRDRIAADTALRVERCDVYVRRWLLDPQNGKPLPTYEYTRYRGGYGSRLPIFLYISRP